MKPLALTTAIAFAAVLAGCTTVPEPGPTVTVTEQTAAEPAPTVTVEVVVTETPETVEPDSDEDPYEVYLENNPDPDLVLSREDAQTRAILGCDGDWAPGTIDAVLQDAYAESCP